VVPTLRALSPWLTKGLNTRTASTLKSRSDANWDAALRLIPATVPGSRIALAGLHSWTDDDFPNIAKGGLSTFSPNDLRDSTQPLLEWLNATGCSRVAIHLDVDVVDSNEAVFGLGAEPEGLTSSPRRSARRVWPCGVGPECCR